MAWSHFSKNIRFAEKRNEQYLTQKQGRQHFSIINFVVGWYHILRKTIHYIKALTLEEFQCNVRHKNMSTQLHAFGALGMNSKPSILN